MVGNSDFDALSYSFSGLPTGISLFLEEASDGTLSARAIPIDSITPVALPASVPLLLSSLGIFAFLRRRRKKSQSIDVELRI